MPPARSSRATGRCSRPEAAFRVARHLADDGPERTEQRRPGALVLRPAARPTSEPSRSFQASASGERHLELGGQRTREVPSAAGEGPGEDQPLGRTSHGDAGAAMADVQHRHRRPGRHLEPLRRGEEEVLVGDGRVGDHPRVEPAGGRVVRSSSASSSRRTSPTTRSVAFARRRVTWWSNTTCESSKGSSPSTSKGRVAAMRLGSVKGRVKDVGGQRRPGQRHHHLVAAPRGSRRGTPPAPRRAAPRRPRRVSAYSSTDVPRPVASRSTPFSEWLPRSSPSTRGHQSALQYSTRPRPSCVGSASRMTAVTRRSTSPACPMATMR